MSVSDRTGEAIKAIVCCSSRSRPWYKECFISFVEESKYIWLQDSQVPVSMFFFYLGRKMVELDLSPFFFHFYLKPVWQADMLLPHPVWTGCRNKLLKDSSQDYYGLTPPVWWEQLFFLPRWARREPSQEMRLRTGSVVSAHCYRGVAFPVHRVVASTFIIGHFLQRPDK